MQSTLEPRNSAECLLHDQDKEAANAPVDKRDDLALHSASRESGWSKVAVNKPLPLGSSLREHRKSPLPDDFSKKLSDRECSAIEKEPSKSNEGSEKDKSKKGNN